MIKFHTYHIYDITRRHFDGSETLGTILIEDGLHRADDFDVEDCVIRPQEVTFIYQDTCEIDHLGYLPDVLTGA